ncbi:MAG: hypothetical protein ACRCX1_01635 [Bacteroidales bacterium]
MNKVYAMGGRTKNKYIVKILIHSFAVFHAISSLVMQSLGQQDAILLTALTISMIVLIATHFDFPLEVTFALALLNSFAGFYLGTAGAVFLQDYVALSPLSSNVITTFMTTEILGWMTYLIAQYKTRKE